MTPRPPDAGQHTKESAMTNNHEPDAETKCVNLILTDLRAAFPGVKFSCVSCRDPPGIQLEFDGNDVDYKAVQAVLDQRDYKGIYEGDIWLDLSPGPNELADIMGILNAPENAQALDEMF